MSCVFLCAAVALWPLIAVAFLVRIGHGPDMRHFVKKVFASRLRVNPDGTTDLVDE